jgi:hypothetical protein
MEMVKDIWANATEGRTPMERWQCKIRWLRQHLRGWAKNTNRHYKKEKKEILNTLDMLEKSRKHTTTVGQNKCQTILK